MKITLNANITPETVDSFLVKQKNKADKIKEFCLKNKIDELQYKDSELEFEYKNNEKPFANPKPKVETRAKGGVNNAKG